MIFNQNLIDEFHNLVAGTEKADAMFRYPGEMLERFQENSFDSESDKISMLYAYAKNMDGFSNDMFVGTQKADFINEMKEFAKETKSVYAMSFLYLMEEADEADVKACMSMNAKACFEYMNDMVVFLYDGNPNLLKPVHVNLSKWRELIAWAAAANPDSACRMKKALPLEEENLKAYKRMMLLAVMMTDGRGNNADFPKEWRRLFKALRSLFTTKTDPDSFAAKVMEDTGYSYEEVLDINCGVFEYTGHSERAYDINGCYVESLGQSSYIKRMRLVRSWIHARLASAEDVPEWAEEIFWKHKTGSMNRKIDGTDSKKEFFFLSMTDDMPNLNNEELLFELCAMENSEINPQYMELHPFGMTYSKELIERLMQYYKQDYKRDILFGACILNEWNRNPRSSGFIQAVKETEACFGLKAKNAWKYGDREISDALYYLADEGFLKMEDMQSYDLHYYVREHYSPKSYEVLKEKWNELMPKECSEFSNFVPKGIDYCHEADMPDEAKRNVVEMELETAFQTGNGYIDLLLDDLKDEEVRKLYSTEELREMYETLNACGDPGVQKSLDRHEIHSLFLSDEEMKALNDKKKEEEDEEKRRKELAKKQEIRDKYMADMKTGRTNSEKVDLLFKANYILLPYGDRDGKILLDVVDELFSGTDVLKLSFEGAKCMTNIAFTCFTSRTMTLRETADFIAKFAVKEE